MNIDPLATALQEIAETQSLLEGLITSSERFDYPKAKIALQKLTRKVRDLARTRAQFEAMLQARAPNIRIVNFRAPAATTPPPGAQRP